MRDFPLLLLICASLMAVAEPQRAEPIIGDWEGESICTLHDSPCHDEHVVYEIKPHTGSKDRLAVDAYKIVTGEKQFMGTLVCTYAAPTLTCSGNTGRNDVWTFTVAGDTMTGELRIDKARTLYRKVRVSRRGH